MPSNWVDDAHTIRHCPRCQRDLPVSDFHIKSRIKGQYQSLCRSCMSDHQREQYAKPEFKQRKIESGARQLERDPERNRRAGLMIRFGLTLEQYDDLVEQHEHCCGICKRHDSEAGRLHVDHDHSCCSTQRTCGKCIRGLLCSSCNLALGKFNDDPSLLRAAYEYLERSRVDTN